MRRAGQAHARALTRLAAAAALLLVAAKAPRRAGAKVPGLDGVWKGPDSIGVGLGNAFSFAQEAGDKGVEGLVGGFFAVRRARARGPRAGGSAKGGSARGGQGRGARAARGGRRHARVPAGARKLTRGPQADAGRARARAPREQDGATCDEGADNGSIYKATWSAIRVRARCQQTRALRAPRAHAHHLARRA